MSGRFCSNGYSRCFTLLWRRLNSHTSQQCQDRQRRACALAIRHATVAEQSSQSDPSLKVRVHSFRPAGITATCPMMWHPHRTRQLLTPVHFNASSCSIILQTSLCFLPALPQYLVAMKHPVLSIHDFPSLRYDLGLVSSRVGSALREYLHSGCRPCSVCDPRRPE